MSLILLRAAHLSAVTDPTLPDLTSRQLLILLATHEEGPQTVRGLAAAMKVSKAVVTYAMDRLEKLEIAHRRPDPQDMRSVLITLLPAGVALLQRMEWAMAVAGDPGKVAVHR